MEQQKLNDEIERFLQSFNDADRREETSQQEPMETIHVYFVREEQEPEPEPDVVEATLATPQYPSALFTVATVFFCLSLVISSIALQLYFMLHPPVAVVTIVPDTRTVTLTGSLPLGRLTHAITLYQSETVQATGKGHQDARAAQGALTFYNASFSPQVVSAGSVFQGSDGAQIRTDTTINVPANNPPQDGIASVTAHAVTPGSHGNLQALDINSATSSSLFAKNLDAFTGGQDARDFQVVAKRDIEATAAPMKPILSYSIQGVLQGELKPNEELLALPCSPAVTSDHQPGDEASQVQVTVSMTCNGVAYDGQALHTRVTQLLSHQAIIKLGAGYSLMGDIQVTGIRAIFPYETPVITFSSRGTWAFGLSNATQERMRSLIAGQTTDVAVHRLLALPGIRSVSTTWEKDIKLPKDRHSIHFIIVIPA